MEGFTMNLKRIAITATITGALGAAALGFGTGLAQAKPHPGPPIPPIPVVPGDVVSGAWLPGDPPGHNPWGPPGQVKKWEVLPGPVPGTVVDNPFEGVPPGHWGEPWRYGLPAWWLPENIPGVIDPLPVVWNPELAAWGVWLDWLNQFIPYPLS
jgi:hypothetical protein